MIVKRVADGDTIRTIEYLSQPVQAVDEMEFYTGVESYDSDEFTYYLWQSQLNQNYLDCAYIYNGTQSSSATISSTGTGEKTFTCAGYTFVAGDVGREIREDLNYDFSEGNAEIIEFVSDHVVKVNVRAEFSALSLTSWVLTTNELTLSSLFYGKKVATLVDGGKGQEYTVANDGTLTLQYQGAYIIVGFKYIGLVKTLNLNAIFKTGNTSDMFKQVANIWASFYNTVSCKFGTTLYNYDELFIGPSNPLGKPPVVYNGMKELHIQDNPRTEKYIYFIKDDYSSCNIQLLNINIDYK